jgi:hypothetical protein
LNKSEKDEAFEEPHKHERFLMFLCFVTTAVIGYFLTNHVALLGV